MTEPTTLAPPAPNLDDGLRRRLDDELQVVWERRQRWVELPIERKIAYARELRRGFHRVAAGQVEAACEAKGIPFDGPLAGEEWLGGPYVNLRHMRLLIDSLEQVRERGGVEIPPATVRTLPDGRAAVRVFPLDLLDRLLYAGFRGEVWMEPGVTRENLDEHLAGAYRQPPEGRLALVLGAGNVASIAPLDAVQKLFVEGRVVALKLNPVNDYLGPFIEDAFAELIADGFVRVLYGGGDVGAYLCHHDRVGEIHITGSAQTHDLIVFGPGEEGAERKREGRPVLDKPISSELGNVSPVIVLPGKWSRGDLRFQAENIATQMVQNGGFNCNAAKVIVTWEAWPQRQALLDEIAAVLESLPGRPAYYPGAGERSRRFREAYPGAATFGEGEAPPTLATGVDAAAGDQLAFGEESFCAFTVETPLGGGDAAAFLERAVAFANDSLEGTLNAGLILDRATRSELGAALEAAVTDLRYGSVGINHWPALSYGLGSTPWGAFPGHTLTDIQSGIGKVHNALLFDRPQKSVVDGPFRVLPKPVWFATHDRAHQVGRRLVELEADPGLVHLPGIVLRALLG